jgi:hypothetical protein
MLRVGAMHMHAHSHKHNTTAARCPDEANPGQLHDVSALHVITVQNHKLPLPAAL